MNCRIRNVALLLTVLALATGLASAQPSIKVSQINNGSVTQYTYDPTSSVTAKAPVSVNAGGVQYYKYWDAQASTDYYNVPSNIAGPPNPQVAVGPDDVFTLVNRTIYRYPNPNSAANAAAPGTTNPYGTVPTSKIWLDTWLGSTLTVLCPSAPSTNATCVVDNASIRYDQLQGRFVVLFTVTDVPSAKSNLVLIVSSLAIFSPGTPGTSGVFTPPIAPVVGGTSLGGVNANWYLYIIPVNLTTATLANVNPALCATGGGAGCTNYFPTAARMGLDNDNIVLVAPVLDQSQTTQPQPTGLTQGGPYAGTRVVVVPKLYVYNNVTATVTNLRDDTATGTLAGCSTAAGAPCATAPTPAVPLPGIFWEPAVLRGRALASFNAQVGLTGTAQAGIIAPLTYLVGNHITDSYGMGAGIDTGDETDMIQSIIYSCPATSIFSAPAGVTFCGNAAGGQVADYPTLGPINSSAAGPNTLGGVFDPAPVGQGVCSSAGAPCTATSSTAPTPTTDTTNLTTKRLFIGDSRPQQILFREGLIYSARALLPVDWFHAHPLATSTVLYHIIKAPGPTAFSTTGFVGGVSAISPMTLFLETMWDTGIASSSPYGQGFYAPMFDVPANVISSNPISPINVEPWLEKLFVGMTTGGTSNISATFAKTLPSLWDFRPGDDAYDTLGSYLDPVTGTIFTTVPCQTGVTGPCPMIPFGARGGATTDPNDGSLWMYGSFGKFREFQVIGPGQWGTSVANYQLDFPVTDPYGNDNTYFQDVQPSGTFSNPFFNWIQIAKNVGIASAATTLTGSSCTFANSPNPPVLQPPGSGSTPAPGTSQQTCGTFAPASTVSRAEMARWVVLSTMNDTQVNTYLTNTGGLPDADLSHFSSFADVASINTVPGATVAQLQRYIEVMYRRGYTKGCGLTADAKRKYCPNDPVTRGQMSVFIIRAKMSNVFPTTLSGVPIAGPSSTYGDNFSLPTAAQIPPFTDVASDPNNADFLPYIMKMRELRITNGTSATTYSPGNNITRDQLATFIVRAFFL